MRYHHSQVRLVPLPLSDRVQHTQPFPEDGCKDAKCTETIVLEIVAAVDDATHGCVGLTGVSGSSLAEEIADVVDVSLDLSPESDAISSQLV